MLHQVKSPSDSVCRSYHFTFFTQQLITSPRQWRTVVFFVSRSLLPNSVRQPAWPEKPVSRQLAFGNVQFDNTLAEHRIRAELHQILTGNQVLTSLRSPSGCHRRTPCGRNDGVVRVLNLFCHPNSGCVYLDLPLAAATDPVHER
ncbi:hypothetical protein ACLB1R_07790 [Escherichia coli]